jgi:hypothetical protein
MEDRELIRLFERGEAPAEGFHHRDHVRVAWWYLRQHPLPQALARFSEALKRFALARNKPTLYHETITVAYVLLINERLADRSADDSWPAFAEANGDLLQWRPSVLDRYYHAETLASARARRVFVLPDKIAPSDPIVRQSETSVTR